MTSNVNEEIDSLRQWFKPKAEGGIIGIVQPDNILYMIDKTDSYPSLKSYIHSGDTALEINNHIVQVIEDVFETSDVSMEEMGLDKFSVSISTYQEIEHLGEAFGLDKITIVGIFTLIKNNTSRFYFTNQEVFKNNPENNCRNQLKLISYVLGRAKLVENIYNERMGSRKGCFKGAILIKKRAI